MLARPVVADDPGKLNAEVDAMARFLATALHMRDLSLLKEDKHVIRCAKAVARQEAKVPMLGQVMNEELRHRPSEQELDRLEELAESYDFALDADALALRMLAACGVVEAESEIEAAHPSDAERDGIDVSVFAEEEPYFQRERCPRAHGDAITLGGLAGLLRNEVTAQARDWLWECERTLCIVHGETWERFGGMEELIARIGLDIAKRITLNGRRSEMSLAAVDHLSADFLEQRGGQEVQRNHSYAQVDAMNDMMALEMLLVLAKHGGSTLAALTILQTKLHLLRRVIESPPSELGLKGDKRSRMNLALLSRVLDCDMPIEVRVRIADQWSGMHGGFAQPAVQEAIDRIKVFVSDAASPFIDVVTMQRGKGGVTLPLAWFAPAAGQWYARPAPTEASTRLGFDGQGRRIVRLTSMVWAMMGHGAFEEGRVARDIALPCAFEAMHHARLMRELVDHERERAKLGVRITSFLDEIENFESDVAHEIDKAMCELSAFSLADIWEAFHPDRALIGRLITPLAARTREQLGNRRTALVPAGYENFARDLLALLLPTVEARRLRIGLPRTTAPNPLSDLLRSTRAVHLWTPLAGRFTLDAVALKVAHPKLREALEHYARQPKSFVRANHLTTRGDTAHRTLCFTFESGPLLQLLRM
ncbi:MAG: hypothetical protein ACKVI4_15695 [Actinomycetales bacterium]|tara:strand:- start:2998 stop:4947 length:1950 start_codon:yes stop_codon:yes gene_type:complete